MLNLNKLKKENKLILKLTNNNLNYYIKNTKRIRKYCDNHKLTLELYYKDKRLTEKTLNENFSKPIKDFITIQKAINIKDKKKRFIYIYDTVCSFLENHNNGYCKFQNDICIRDQLKNNTHKNGCCECLGRGKCNYLINSVCTLKNCISCKLFICKTLKQMGIEENLNDYVLLKYFFTEKQKDILRFSYWTPKEVIIDRLLKNKYVRP